MAVDAKSLLPGEVVLMRGRPHWKVFVMAGVHAAVAAALAVAAAVQPGAPVQKPAVVGAGAEAATPAAPELAAQAGTSGVATAIFAAAGVFLVLAIGSAAVGQIGRMSKEILVTNRRVIVREGLLSTRTTELMLFKVESLEVEQSLAGRIFGFGDLVLHGTGGQPTRMLGIGSPMDLRNAVQGAIETAGKGAGG